MTTVKVKKKLKGEQIVFSGMLDSDPFTQNGDVMRLFVTHCTPIGKGKRERVRVKILELDRYFNEEGKTVDEGSADDIIGEFEGCLENRGGTYCFSDMKPVEAINWSKTAPYPYFRVTFARESDKVTNTSDNETDAETFPVVIRESDEPPESPIFEIGFIVEKEDGTFLGGSDSAVSYFSGAYSYKPILDLFDMRTQLDSVNLLNITNAQIAYAPAEDGDDDELVQALAAEHTQVHDRTVAAYNEKKIKAIEAALERIEKLIKTSRNPYFQNIQAVNDYYRKLELYKTHAAEYQKMRESELCTASDCFALESALIRPMAGELHQLEKQIHDYLSGSPPKEYRDRIERNIAIITRNDEIDRILNNPAVQIMGLLPGAGVVTGTLKLIQGNITDGLLDVFGAVVNYGGFLKLARVARAYRKASRNTVELLYSYRYRKLVSSITSTDVMNKITETSLKHSGTFLGNLFDTVGTFQSLRGHVDSIAILHRNRQYILKMTERAIRGIESGGIPNAEAYLAFLNKLGRADEAAEFFAHIRLLHAVTKGGKDAYAVTLEAMGDVNRLLGFAEVPGIKDFDATIVRNTDQLFRLMSENEFKIDNILAATTSGFHSNSAIMDHFNKSLAHYDMFGVNRNADVRYRNTRAEMLLALDEIEDRWSMERRSRDDWIKANARKYLDQYPRELQLTWARETKRGPRAGLPQTLEESIASFIERLRGQIELREALGGKGELKSLKNTFNEGRDHDTGLLFDIDMEFFVSHAGNLVRKYY